GPERTRRQYSQPPGGAREERALGAKRFDLGGARVLHQSLVFGRFNSDQGDLAFGVVMNSPPVTLRQRRHAKARVPLTQELLAFFRPAGLRDVMEDGVHPKAMSSSVYVYGCLTSSSYSTTAFVLLP